MSVKLRGMWAGEDLNPHPVRDTVLSRARLPISPPAQTHCHDTKSALG